MRLSIIFKITGGLLRGFSLMFLWPLAVALLRFEVWRSANWRSGGPERVK